MLEWEFLYGLSNQDWKTGDLIFFSTKLLSHSA